MFLNEIVFLARGLAHGGWRLNALSPKPYTLD
jgi:hypothetical protein